MRAFASRLLLLVPVCALMVGCEPQADRTPAEVLAKADTAGPRALLGRWHAALVSGDKMACMACFVGTQDELVLALAVQEVVQANYAFRDAVVSAYGEEGWQAIQQSQVSRIGLLPRDPAWAQTITLARMGPVALGYQVQGRVPLHMSQTGGLWRLHASGFVPPGQDAGRAADYLFRWAATLRELADGIREGRVKADRASNEVEKDFKARLAPDEQPAAAEAVEHLMMH